MNLVDYILVFVSGGVLCAIAQLLIDLTRLTPARILVLYVTLGVALGALGWYQPLIDYAGAGATTPLTGFGYLIAKGTREAVDAQGLLGAITGGLGKTAGGIAAALIFGYLAALLFKGRSKS